MLPPCPCSQSRAEPFTACWKISCQTGVKAKPDSSFSRMANDLRKGLGKRKRKRIIKKIKVRVNLFWFTLFLAKVNQGHPESEVKIKKYSLYSACPDPGGLTLLHFPSSHFPTRLLPPWQNSCWHPCCSWSPRSDGKHLHAAQDFRTGLYMTGAEQV